MHSTEYGQRRLDATAVYLILRGGISLFFGLVFTVNMIYFVTDLQLNPLQLVLVGTVMEAAVFLFEVPTGVVADVYSRRLSIILGVVLLGLSFVLLGAVPTYAAVLIAQVIWGIGYTFTSGAVEAWIADEVGEQRAGQIFMRGSQAGSLGSIIGTIAAVGLAAVTGLHVPILLGGVLLLGLALFLIATMPETGFRRASGDERRSWAAMFDTFRDGVRLVRIKPVLIGILAIGVVYGVASEGYDRLWHKHLIDTITLPGPFEPVVWFGIISLAGTGISLVLKEVVRRRVDFNSPVGVARAAMVLNALIAGGILVLALTDNLIVAVAALWLIGPLRATSDPVFTAWINQSLDPRVRATVLSMSGQVDALGQVVGGPAVGMVGSLVSVRAALAVSAVIWAAATPLYRRSIRRPAAVIEPASGD
ncbi:MAG TPA: MFS transporter [Spirillospora sp.]|nr:MFS transporter [Spirillospora sp.]